jgi:hypothetical protein
MVALMRMPQYSATPLSEELLRGSERAKGYILEVFTCGGRTYSDVAGSLGQAFLKLDGVSSTPYAHALGQIGKTGVPFLIKGILSSDSRKVLASLQAVNAVGPEARDASGSILTIFPTLDVDSKEKAVDALSSLLGDEREALAVALNPAMRDQDKAVRIYAFNAYAASGRNPEERVHVLITAMSDSDPGIRKWGAYHIQFYGRSEAVRVALPVMREILLHDPEIGETGPSIAWSLGTIGKEAILVLVDGISCTPNDTSEYVFHGMGHVSNAPRGDLVKYQDRLIPALSKSVKGYVSIGRTPTGQMGVLLSYAEGNPPRGQTRAAALKIVTDLLASNSDGILQSLGYQALAKLADWPTTRGIVDKSDNQQLRWAAVRAMEEIAHGGGVSYEVADSYLKKVAETDNNPDIRKAAKESWIGIQYEGSGDP